MKARLSTPAASEAPAKVGLWSKAGSMTWFEGFKAVLPIDG